MAHVARSYAKKARAIWLSGYRRSAIAIAISSYGSINRAITCDKSQGHLAIGLSLIGYRDRDIELWIDQSRHRTADNPIARSPIARSSIAR
jgi:hypothetical protein